MVSLVEAARREVAMLAGQKRWASALSTFGFPAAFGFWVAVPSLGWFTIPATEFFAVLVVLVAGWILFGVASTKSAFLATELYFEHSETERKLDTAMAEGERLTAGIVTLSRAVEATASWTLMLHEYHLRGMRDRDDLREAILEVLATVTERKDLFLGIESGELWNFAVYGYDSSANLLRPLVRIRHADHPSTGEGRVWAPGLGHVGLAFARRSAVITPDSNDGGVKAILAAPADLAQDYDPQTYISLAAIPIMPSRGDDPPLGVLVGTSSRKGRFTEANALILQQAAPVLACVMSIPHIGWGAVKPPPEGP